MNDAPVFQYFTYFRALCFLLKFDDINFTKFINVSEISLTMLDNGWKSYIFIDWLA